MFIQAVFYFIKILPYMAGLDKDRRLISPINSTTFIVEIACCTDITDNQIDKYKHKDKMKDNQTYTKGTCQKLNLSPLSFSPKILL